MSDVKHVHGEFICVVCPNGCPIDAEFSKTTDGKSELISFSGNACPKGETWIKQEIESPMRTIATSVPVDGGDLLLASVRTNRPIPLDKVTAVMDEARRVRLTAPVHIGQVIISAPAGVDADIIATRNIASAR